MICSLLCRSKKYLKPSARNEFTDSLAGESFGSAFAALKAFCLEHGRCSNTKRAVGRTL